jgi:DNA-binding beta-propeller fold protein YncE
LLHPIEEEFMRRAILAAAVVLASCSPLPLIASGDTPAFRVDPNFPKPLPEEDGVQTVFGQVSGIAVDDRTGHIWAIHRPSTLLPDECDPKTLQPVTQRCCKPLPSVVELDASGNYLRGWGPTGKGYDWPKSEHGIYVDPEGNVWIAGNGNEDNQILKFTADGKFLMQIGHAGPSEGSNSRTQLGRPAHMMLDSAANELYVADGYGNHRVIVFDATTGAYKRHWGAYGAVPGDDKQPPYDPAQAPSRQFGNPVHCVRLSNDGLVYVCDRANDRIQVFDKQGQFKQEFRVETETRANGSVWDMVLSEDRAQKLMYVADGANGRVYVLRRSDGKVLGSFGRTGRMAGEFKWVHNIAIDNRGNLYTSEVGYGRRIQKFEHE